VCLHHFPILLPHSSPAPGWLGILYIKFEFAGAGVYGLVGGPSKYTEQKKKEDLFPIEKQVF
jgi:hypothetical protein